MMNEMISMNKQAFHFDRAKYGFLIKFHQYYAEQSAGWNDTMIVRFLFSR